MEKPASILLATQQLTGCHESRGLTKQAHVMIENRGQVLKNQQLAKPAAATQ
jgi:hypothetical protein